MENATTSAGCCPAASALPNASVRSRILAVATALFAERGYDATSVRGIAERVGVTVPALYYHFGSKHGILSAVLDSFCRERIERVRAAAETGATWTERLTNSLRAYLEFLERDTGAAMIVLRDPFLFADRDWRRRVIASETEVAEVLTGLVRGGTEAGEFRALDPAQVAVLLLGATRAIIMRAVWNAQEESKPDPASTLVDLVLSGLLSSRVASS